MITCLFKTRLQMEQADAVVKGIMAALLSCNSLTNAIFTGSLTYRNEIEMRFVKDLIFAVDERVNKLECQLDKEYLMPHL